VVQPLGILMLREAQTWLGLADESEGVPAVPPVPPADPLFAAE
jgi:hypothetical protein